MSRKSLHRALRGGERDVAQRVPQTTPQSGGARPQVAGELEVMIAEQRKSFQASITKLEATVAHQRKEMEALTASLKEQAAQIQKVSDQLEVSKAAPQMVVNNQ